MNVMKEKKLYIILIIESYYLIYQVLSTNIQQYYKSKFQFALVSSI